MSDIWITIIVIVGVSLEITFFWWLFTCDGWVKLQKFGDKLAYRPKHRKMARLEKQIHYIETMMTKTKLNRRLSGYAVNGHVFCRSNIKAEIASKK